MKILDTEGQNKGLFKYLFLGALLVFFLILPFFLDPYLLHIMIMTFLFAYLSRSWDLIGGYTGQNFWGPSAMFGIGGYTSTLLFVHLKLTPWLGMLIGGILGMIVGILLCYVSSRFSLRGIYFGLATLTFSQIGMTVVLNVDAFGGVNGVLLPLIRGNSLLQFQFHGKIPYYYIAFFMMMLSIYVMYRIEKSKSGYYYIAIREDEDAAQALGVDTLKYKLIPTGIGCFFLAMGGTLHAQYLLFVNPDFFGLPFTIEMIIRSILGGVGTLFGPIIGSFILTPLSEISRGFLGGYRGVHMMIYGVIMILFMLFLPRGVGAWLEKLYDHLKNLFEGKIRFSG